MFHFSTRPKTTATNKSKNQFIVTSLSPTFSKPTTTATTNQKQAKPVYFFITEQLQALDLIGTYNLHAIYTDFEVAAVWLHHQPYNSYTIPKIWSTCILWPQRGLVFPLHAAKKA